MIAPRVALGRLKGIVYRLLGKVEKKGLIRLALVAQPLDGLTGENIRIVALELTPLPIDIQSRIEVLSLADEADPVIETRASRIIVVPHVPLADEGRLNAGLLQVAGKKTVPSGTAR